MSLKRTYADYLRDMVEYAQKAEGFVHRMGLADFQKQEQTVLAVVRSLEVIGEAAKHIPQTLRRRYSDIPLRKITAMRNVVIHEYFGIDIEVIWKTVREDLPPLRAAVARMLAEVEEKERDR